MMSYLRFILTLAAALICIEGSAQKIETMRNNLSSRTIDGSYVRVTEDSSVKEAVTTVEQQKRANHVSGFRIVIFSNNGQYAGDNAKQVLNNFRNSFPHINAYLVYESPYFKVSVGDCLTMEEAQILMAELLGQYPKAFPKREDIKLSNLQDVRIASPNAVDSLAHDTASPITSGVDGLN